MKSKLAGHHRIEFPLVPCVSTFHLEIISVIQALVSLMAQLRHVVIVILKSETRKGPGSIKMNSYWSEYMSLMTQRT